MMMPDWKPLATDDPLYEAGKVKFASNAYGFAMDDLPDVGPDSHAAPTYWSITRVPMENVIGSRFIATKV